MPGQRLLIVGARAAWRPERPDLNAILVDAAGDQLVTATFGDGIEDVQTTLDGEIWVSYFDEGVYGNFGWGRPGPAPIGHRGIVRFDADLTKRWEFPAHTDAPYGAIDDCYAMNVTPGRVWACYYSDFPVVCIESDTVRAWRNSVRGAKAIAVGPEDSILLAGGYRPDHDRLIHGQLDNDQLTVLAEHQITLPNGDELPEQLRIIGRGPHLFIIVDHTCYRITTN